MTMTFDVELTEKDFLEAWLLSGKRSRRVKTIWICGCGLFAVGIGCYSQFAHVGSDAFVNGFFLGAGAWMVITGALLPTNVSNALKKAWVQSPIYAEPKQFTFDDAAFHSTSYSGHSVMYWHAFSHWQETPRLLLIYFGPQLSFCIPKRCLGTDTNLKQLRDFLATMIGRTKYVFPTRGFAVTFPTSTENAPTATPEQHGVDKV